ncbi:hypothetical protein HNW13_017620 [Shewanella sp. BF02_Schw]|uniref:hypothetical protein n=1 Tax=Shewanella sp. BF02_Schw TaxID=394908 RepID=UPI0017801CC1|nr:hypothetical protein [Shewanella sp. BF02_Schw]MBO1897559.1 hypothetical protein [Shewanella sp. BF02_Schw]
MKSLSNSHITPVTFDGNVFANKSQLARFYGANPRTFQQRLRFGESIEASLKLKRKSGVGLGCFYRSKVYKNMSELAAEYNVSADALRKRLNNSWPLEEALEIKVRVRKYDSRVLIVNGVKFRSLKAVADVFCIELSELKHRFEQDRCISAAVSPIYNSFYTPDLNGSMVPLFFNRRIYPCASMLINELINKGLITEKTLLQSISIIYEFINKLANPTFESLSTISDRFCLPFPVNYDAFNEFINKLHKEVYSYDFDMLFHSEMPFIMNCNGLAEELSLSAKLW